MTSQTITIPAREVRPGDVLFGMTVRTSNESGSERTLWHLVTEGPDLLDLWLRTEQKVTVERPVPSDPIGTVRAEFVNDSILDVYLKTVVGGWRSEGRTDLFRDAEVADLPILWKPGMPIPNTEVTA